MLPNKMGLMIKLPIIHNRPHKVEVMHKKSHDVLEIQGTLENFATLRLSGGIYDSWDISTVPYTQSFHNETLDGYSW